MQRDLAAYAYCLFLTALYVLSLYVMPQRVRALPRDNPLHIRWRLATASLATLLSIALCYLAIGSLISLPYKGVIREYDSGNFLVIIGFRIDRPIVTYLLYLATSWKYDIGYDGCLTLRGGGDGRGRPAQSSVPVGLRKRIARLHYEHVRPHWNLITFRAIVFAPVSEEVVFRALMLPVLAVASDGTAGNESHRLALLCPAFFAVAHLHHLYEKVTKNGVPLRAAVAGTCVQAAYTGVFGYIASLLFLRTGSVVTPIVSHIFCNCMGLPDVSFAERGKELSFLYPHRLLLLLLHALGIALFAVALAPLTQAVARGSLYWQ